MATQPKYTGGVYLCKYCGEMYASKAIYCKDCRTQDGRKKTFDANVAIAKENKAKGMTVPTGFRNWK